MDFFKGTRYFLSDMWFNVIDLTEFINRPINYLEIGTFYGANLFSVANSYGIHLESKLHCIDPWDQYSDYDEYINQYSDIYSTFCENLSNYENKDKITVHRGYSHNEVPKFDDEFFDIIYIDGNHNSEYVLEDAVLSFRKLKHDGI